MATQKSTKDLIIKNLGPEQKFTQVPNELLRDPSLSLKAKGLLCQLLSNKDGWKSHIKQLENTNKDGRDGIKKARTELQQEGYLVLLNIKDKKTKKFVGTLWGYSYEKYTLNLKKYVIQLDKQGFELVDKQGVLTNHGIDSNGEAVDGFSVDGFSGDGFSGDGKSATKNTNTKNTKNKNTNIDNCEPQNGSPRLTKEQKAFLNDKTGKLIKSYPKPVNTSVQKEKIKTLLARLLYEQNIPWRKIHMALRFYKHSKLWEDTSKIPQLITWLEQKWYDSPEAMVISFELSEIIKSYMNVSHDIKRIKSWSVYVSKLLKSVDYEQIQESLDWYAEHVNGEYIPVIESGKSLYEKYSKLVAAIKRDQFKPDKKLRNTSGVDKSIKFDNDGRTTVIKSFNSN